MTGQFSWLLYEFLFIPISAEPVSGTFFGFIWLREKYNSIRTDAIMGDDENRILPVTDGRVQCLPDRSRSGTAVSASTAGSLRSGGNS